MLELYQFELSHYCEKIRFILDYKGLTYRKIEVTPGLGQLDLYRLSGQQQVPVLKENGMVVADSTAIAQYLERQYPDPPVIPANSRLRGLCLMLEEWADASIGLNARKAMVGAFNQDQSFRTAFLPDNTADILRSVVEALPGNLLGILGTGVGFSSDAIRIARQDLQHNLEALSLMLNEQPYLVTDAPTLADFAVAGLSMYIKFPQTPALDLPDRLKGKGVPGLADNPDYATFFHWREQLYQTYRKVSL